MLSHDGRFNDYHSIRWREWLDSVAQDVEERDGYDLKNVSFREKVNVNVDKEPQKCRSKKLPAIDLN